MPKCKSCGADIIWLKTKSGKSMPCNTEPVRYWLDIDGPDKIVTQDGKVVTCALNQLSIVPPTGLGYIPHWASCPKADEHRRKLHG